MANRKPKVVVLFGAGASYGSGGLKHAPPLGNALFDDLVKKSPIWHSLLNDQSCVDEFRRGFEYGMDYILKKQFTGEYSDLYSLLIEQAYVLLDYHIQKPDHNKYFQLCQKYLSELKGNELQFASLNYDCLLDEVIYQLDPDLEPCYWGDANGIRLLKPHGSCNFVCPPFMTGGGSIILRRPEDLSCPIVPIHPLKAKKRISNCGGAPPGISIYNTTKVNSIKSEEISLIRKEFQESVRGAELTVIIGVYPKLQGDDHIWNEIRNAKGLVGLVDKREYCDRWRQEYRTGRDDPKLKETFSDSYSGLRKLIEKHL
jgi:hypothetical protein